MTMPSAPEFTAAEIAATREWLVHRYDKEVEIHLADTELQIDQQSVSCPAISWYQRKANFIVFKVGPRRFRARFFYTPHEQFGSTIIEFSHLEECVAVLLQTKTDHEREKRTLIR